MSELRALLADTTERVLGSNPDWAGIEDAGLTKVLVPEEQGGFGGTWEDAYIVVRACGAHAIDHPIAEAILDSANVNDRDLYGAMMLAAKMAGALGAALDLSVQYTRERQQFGKQLASFQAIQQQLAVLAEEAAAADMAAAAAFRAADFVSKEGGDAWFEIACAKLRANQAARIGTGIAHQVHGAMGFTAEYRLQHLTRRLWAWGSEHGNERHWADRIGARIAARGPANFWPDLVG
ncbi:MAG TPA: acyl-CoA dehydrogenase family protein [Rhizomicrobium sp.]|nr:acyl-CoA dehydrogenase family protein [Rhizomicrobium sp.]